MKSFLYPVPPVPVPSPPPEPLEEVSWELEDGTRAAGWYRPGAAGPEAPAALFFHGNGENLETLRQAGTLENLAGFTSAVLAVDYPGYGRSGGEPSEAANLEAGRAALAWLAERHPDRPRAVVGWSLGAAVAIRLAADGDVPVDALALLSPWTRLADVAKVHFPAFLVGWLLDERYDSLAAADEVDCPTLVMHGADDRIIPAEQGRRLAEALGARARWVEVEGAGHNDLLARRRPWEELAELVGGARRGSG